MTKVTDQVDPLDAAEVEEAPPPSASPLEPTSAANWPTKKITSGTVVELPSGGIATLKRPPLQYLLATGRVPTKLWARLQKDGPGIFMNPFANLQKEEIKLLIDWMIAESFVEPIVAMTRKSGEIFIDDLSDDDKAFVMGELRLSVTG